MRAWVPLFVVVWMVSAGSALAIERNAFLNRPATTTKQLVEQVKNDPVVADRFMRHYAMTKAELVRYLSGLRVSVLRMGGEYRVYSCLPSGVIRSRLLTLKPGTRVWEDKRGIPILKMSCGNPMSWNVSVFKEPTSVPAIMEPLIVLDSALREATLFETAAEPEEPVAESPEEVALLVPSVPEMSFGEWPEVATAQVTPSVPLLPGSGFNLGFLGSLLVIPLLDLGGGGEPIPEPSMLVGTGGALLLIGLRLRRRSK